MAHSNNHYGAPMGFCDNHGMGYVKSIGCADCNAKLAEANVSKTNKLMNDAVSVRIFPGDDLLKMANEKTIIALAEHESGRRVELKHVAKHNFYLFIGKDNPNLLYTMINKDQAIEITIGSGVTPTSTKPSP